MKKLIFCTLLSMVVLLHSCATIFNGSSQRIHIDSYPQGAEVSINGDQIEAVTPCYVNVQRSSEPLSIKVKKEGYKNQSQQLHSSMSGWIV